MRHGTVAAVDLGATSGRVVLGRVDANSVAVQEVSRFRNDPVRTPDGLHWSILELYRDLVEGLAGAVRAEPGLVSIGIDSWAVDYALLREGRMLGTPFTYRDERNATGVAAAHALVPAERLYAANGLQHLPFNTLFQLTVDRMSGTLSKADTFLLVPDLLAYWLSGESVAEYTNATTTGLVGVTTRQWDEGLIEQLALPRRVFPTLVPPGTPLGGIVPTAARGVGTTSAIVTTVGSHDTASAVVGVPATTPDFGYISCGTWSLVGVELDHPVLGEASRLAGFTNEGGVDDRYRYLHNVMGLWLLTECVRDWQRSGESVDLTALLDQAAAVGANVPLFDVDDPAFLAPGAMPARIATWFSEHDLAAPADRPTMVRSILASLAIAYARAIQAARQHSGARVSVIHLVGGGSRNALLCQLTADATGLPVLAGPVEATAIGNVLVQARAHGIISGDLESLRAVIARSVDVTRYGRAIPPAD